MRLSKLEAIAEFLDVREGFRQTNDSAYRLDMFLERCASGNGIHAALHRLCRSDSEVKIGL